MIYINHAKRSIFIHIPKTGGSHIGPILVKYYGFTNYIHVLQKKRQDHDAITNNSNKSLKMTGTNKFDTSFFNKTFGLLMYCKTSDYLNKAMNMDDYKWEHYIKFCFIRNPYVRALSGWRHFRQILNVEKHFYTYINQKDIMNNISDIEYGHIFMSQKKHIVNEYGDCGVNIIGRYEHVKKDLSMILKRIGFEEINHPDNYFTELSKKEEIILERKTVDKINELFEDDFEMFHYSKL